MFRSYFVHEQFHSIFQNRHGEKVLTVLRKNKIRQKIFNPCGREKIKLHPQKW